MGRVAGLRIADLREPRAKRKEQRQRAKAKSKGKEQRQRAKAKSKGKEQRQRAKSKGQCAKSEVQPFALLLALCPLHLHDPFAQCLGDGFGFRVNLQLGVDVFQMKGDCVGRDSHRASGGLFVMALDEQFEEFSLLGRQVI